jgi:hypothetical protein
MYAEKAVIFQNGGVMDAEMEMSPGLFTISKYLHKIHNILHFYSTIHLPVQPILEFNKTFPTSFRYAIDMQSSYSQSNPIGLKYNGNLLIPKFKL